jgi:hypothetical protein
MDDIWRKAAKNLCKRERLSAIQTRPETKPAIIAAPTTTPTYTHPIASANTVAQVDIRLLKMEQNWVQTHAGPFPEGIRNSMMNLWAALIIREEEAARGADSLLWVNEEGEMSERQERSREESREREKTPTKFNWADDVDASPTPIHNTCNECVLDATDNVSATGISIGTIPIGPTCPPNTIVTTIAAPTTPVTHTRDFSALRSSAPNPWASLRHRRYHRYSRTPQQSESVYRKCFAHSYPVNTPIHKHPISTSTPSGSFRVFETVKHPYGIGPNKPVIRVPVSIATDTPTHHVVHRQRAIVKSAAPLLHQTATL